MSFPLSLFSSEKFPSIVFAPIGILVGLLDFRVRTSIVADPTHPCAGQSRGFGFVSFGTKEAADKAIADMNGAELDGRSINCNMAQVCMLGCVFV